MPSGRKSNGTARGIGFGRCVVTGRAFNGAVRLSAPLRSRGVYLTRKRRTLQRWSQTRRTSMTREAKTKALIDIIERRLTRVSEAQHTLAVEKARLLEHLTPLRLGIVAPDTAVAQLKAKGVTLRGLSAAWSPARRPRLAILNAV